MVGGRFAMAIPTIRRDNLGTSTGRLVTMTNLDKLDHLLIARLREDARAPVAELARSLGVSRTTVQSRIARLERAKVITGYSVRLAESFEKHQINAYVMITVGPKRAAGVSAEIKRMPAVRLLQSVSGAFDMIALASTPRRAGDGRSHRHHRQSRRCGADDVFRRAVDEAGSLVTTARATARDCRTARDSPAGSH